MIVLPRELQMMNGNLFDVDHPERAVYDIDLVATIMGRICRYNNHCHYHYSDAEHSYHASYLWPANPKGALMHDAPEFITGDFLSPIKQRIKGFKEIEWRIERDMETRFNYTQPEPAFKEIDIALFCREEEVLFPNARFPGQLPQVEIHCWSPEMATEMFLQRYWELTNG